jgi:hypothetical protein
MVMSESLSAIFFVLPFVNLLFATQIESVPWTLWLSGIGQALWALITGVLFFQHRAYLKEKLPGSAIATLCPPTAWALLAPRFEITLSISCLIAVILGVIGITLFKAYDLDTPSLDSTTSTAPARSVTAAYHTPLADYQANYVEYNNRNQIPEQPERPQSPSNVV